MLFTRLQGTHDEPLAALRVFFMLLVDGFVTYTCTNGPHHMLLRLSRANIRIYSAHLVSLLGLSVGCHSGCIHSRIYLGDRPPIKAFNSETNRPLWAGIPHMSSKLMVRERVLLYGLTEGVFGPGRTLEVCVECLWTPCVHIFFLLLLLCILCYNKSQ